MLISKSKTSDVFDIGCYLILGHLCKYFLMVFMSRTQPLWTYACSDCIFIDCIFDIQI